MRSDDGIFEDDFIEERRKGLEQFINKQVFAVTLACALYYSSLNCVSIANFCIPDEIES